VEYTWVNNKTYIRQLFSWPPKNLDEKLKFVADSLGPTNKSEEPIDTIRRLHQRQILQGPPPESLQAAHLLAVFQRQA
jgi:hypothetical protein